MKTQHIVGVVAVVVAVLVGIYLANRKDEPAPAPAQAEGMSGMSGMDGMTGMSADSEAAAPDTAPQCLRYDLVNGAWVCSATAPANAN